MKPEPLINKRIGIASESGRFVDLDESSGFWFEDIKAAVEFYLRYKDKPMELVEDFPELISFGKEIQEIIYRLTDLIAKYRVSTNVLGRVLMNNLGFNVYDTEYLEKEIIKYRDKLFKLIRKNKEIDFKDINEYNEWLFKLTFKDILEDDKNARP